MTAGISHFAIRVLDLAAAERFYCGVLGLPVRRRWPNPTGSGDRSLWLETGDSAGTFLALEVSAAPELGTSGDATRNSEHGGHHLLALRITSGQRTTFEARLSAAGVAVSHRTAFTIYFKDPEGNFLGLSHYPDSVADASPASAISSGTGEPA